MTSGRSWAREGTAEATARVASSVKSQGALFTTTPYFNYVWASPSGGRMSTESGARVHRLEQSDCSSA